MQNKFFYFLTVAEELNISKAAKKLFVSQQCLSSHVKKLEREYNTVFFNRKPKLSLTPAGESMQDVIKQIMTLEMNLKAEISSDSRTAKGYIRLGIHSSRSEQFGTMILANYWNKYPNVVISIKDGTTDSFEYLLNNGQIDAYIGVNPIANVKHEQVCLYGERLFVAMTDNFIRHYFPGQYPACLERFAEGIDLREFETIPFFLPGEGESVINNALTDYLLRKDLKLNIKAFSNNGLLRDSLAAMDYGVALCTELRKKTIECQASTRQQLVNPLLFFKIKDIGFRSRVYLIYRKDAYHPQYFYRFVDSAKETFDRL